MIWFIDCSQVFTWVTRPLGTELRMRIIDGRKTEQQSSFILKEESSSSVSQQKGHLSKLGFSETFVVVGNMWYVHFIPIIIRTEGYVG